MPNPLKKVKKAVSNVDDGLKRALEVAGLPLEAAAKVAEVAAQGAKDYYNKKPKEGSQPLTKEELNVAMNIGAGTLGGVNWMKGAGKLNAARAAKMESARSIPKTELTGDQRYLKIYEDELQAFKDYLNKSPSHPDNTFIGGFEEPLGFGVHHPEFKTPEQYFNAMIRKYGGIEGYVKQMFDDIAYFRRKAGK